MATIEELIAEIEQIGGYLKGWTSLTEMPQIERDLALQRLSKVYDAMRGTEVNFGRADNTENSLPDVEVEFVFDETEDDQAESEDFDNEEDNDQLSTENIAAVEQTKPENRTMVAEDEQKISEKELFTIEPKEPADESQLFVNEDIITRESVHQTATDSQAEKPAPQTTYQNHNRIDKHVIDTLYGDMPMPNVAARASLKSQPEAIEIDLFDDVVLKNETPSMTIAEIDMTEIVTEKPILGDMLNHGSSVLNESFSATTHQDWATKIASNGTDLRKFIGINDRFMLVRELFGGNSTAYDQGIDKFNEFNDIDECFIYIQEHYQWNPNHPATTLMIELINRKYTN